MVTIDYELCINCFLCMKECPMFCFSEVDGKLVLTESGKNTCIGCGNCIQSCPTLALDWDYNHIRYS